MTAILLSVAEITISMSLIIGLVLVLSNQIKNKFSPKCRYIVWTLILLRLCFPAGVISVPTLFTIDLSGAVAAEAQVLPLDPSKVTELAGSGEAEQSKLQSSDKTPNHIDIGTTSGIHVTESHKPVTYADILRWAGAVWLAVAVAHFSVSFISNYYALSSFKGRRRLPSVLERGVLMELCREMGIKRAPGLYRSSAVSSPLLYGYFRPAILLPEIELSEAGLRGVLAHELTHYKRGDLWIKLVALIATSIHWFNPLVHTAATQCNSEMELSCDRSVLFGMDEDSRRSYGFVMLSIIKGCRQKTGALTTRFNPRKNAVKERFINILDMSSKRHGRTVIAAAVVLCMIAGAFVGCTVEKPDANDVSDKDNIDNEEVEEIATEEEILRLTSLAFGNFSDGSLTLGEMLSDKYVAYSLEKEVNALFTAMRHRRQLPFLPQLDFPKDEMRDYVYAEEIERSCVLLPDGSLAIDIPINKSGTIRTLIKWSIVNRKGDSFEIRVDEVSTYNCDAR